MRGSSVSPFGMSFLDVLSCGFGAVILLCLIFAGSKKNRGDISGSTTIISCRVVSSKTGVSPLIGVFGEIDGVQLLPGDVSRKLTIQPETMGAGIYNLLLEVDDFEADDVFAVFLNDLNNHSGNVVVEIRRNGVLTGGDGTGGSQSENVQRLQLSSATPIVVLSMSDLTRVSKPWLPPPPAPKSRANVASRSASTFADTPDVQLSEDAKFDIVQEFYGGDIRRFWLLKKTTLRVCELTSGRLEVRVGFDDRHIEPKATRAYWERLLPRAPAAGATGPAEAFSELSKLADKPFFAALAESDDRLTLLEPQTGAPDEFIVVVHPPGKEPDRIIGPQLRQRHQPIVLETKTLQSTLSAEVVRLIRQQDRSGFAIKALGAEGLIVTRGTLRKKFRWSASPLTIDKQHVEFRPGDVRPIPNWITTITPAAKALAGSDELISCLAVTSRLLWHDRYRFPADPEIWALP